MKTKLGYHNCHMMCFTFRHIPEIRKNHYLGHHLAQHHIESNEDMQWLIDEIDFDGDFFQGVRHIIENALGRKLCEWRHVTIQGEGQDFEVMLDYLVEKAAFENRLTTLFSDLNDAGLKPRNYELDFDTNLGSYLLSGSESGPLDGNDNGGDTIVLAEIKPKLP